MFLGFLQNVRDSFMLGVFQPLICNLINEIVDSVLNGFDAEDEMAFSLTWYWGHERGSPVFLAFPFFPVPFLSEKISPAIQVFVKRRDCVFYRLDRLGQAKFHVAE